MISRIATLANGLNTNFSSSADDKTTSSSAGILSAVSNQNVPTTSEQSGVSNQDFLEIMAEATNQPSASRRLISNSADTNSGDQPFEERLDSISGTPPSSMGPAANPTASGEPTQVNSVALNNFGALINGNDSKRSSLSPQIDADLGLVAGGHSVNRQNLSHVEKQGTVRVIGIRPGTDKEMVVTGSGAMQTNPVAVANAPVLVEASQQQSSGIESKAKPASDALTISPRDSANGNEAIALSTVFSFTQPGQAAEVAPSTTLGSLGESETSIEAFSLLLRPSSYPINPAMTGGTISPTITNGVSTLEHADGVGLKADQPESPIVPNQPDTPTNAAAIAFSASESDTSVEAFPLTLRGSSYQVEPAVTVGTTLPTVASGVTDQPDSSVLRDPVEVVPSPTSAGSGTSVLQGWESALRSGATISVDPVPERAGQKAPNETVSRVSPNLGQQAAYRYTNLAQPSGATAAQTARGGDNQSGSFYDGSAKDPFEDIETSESDHRQSATALPPKSPVDPADAESSTLPSASQLLPTGHFSESSETNPVIQSTTTDSGGFDQQRRGNVQSPSGNAQPDLIVTNATPTISTAQSIKSTPEMQSSGRGQPIDSTQAGTSGPQAAGPVKEISIRVQASSGETVHLRIVDQLSQVQVGVRSSNASLASSLRQDLSSLTATLDRLGWKPEVAGTAIPGATVLSEAASGTNEQPDDSHSQTMDWWNETEHNKRSPNELWEEALNRQTS